MDSDDTITEECGSQLKQLVEGDHPDDVLGYVMQVHCPALTADNGQDVTVVDHVKLFRNQPEFRFEGRIHEQVLPAIRRAGGDVVFTNIYVSHSGSDQTETGHRRKIERDLRILHRELEEQPDHPFVLFNLGMTYADDGRYAEAVEYLNGCLSVARPAESHVRKVYALLVSSLVELDRHDEARSQCATALRLFEDDPELLFRMGLLQQHFGDLAAAVECYEQALQGSKRRHFSSVDQGISGHKARHNLALVFEEQGKTHEAEQQWRLILEQRPQFRPAWRGLADLLLRDERFEDLSELARAASKHSELRGDAITFAARVLEKGGKLQDALQLLTEADPRDDFDDVVLREQCRLTFEKVSPAAAEGPLTRLVERDPIDAAALHNLAIANLHTGRPDQAITFSRRSLGLRPDYVPTLVQLAYALRDTGQHRAARDTLERAGTLAPDSPLVREAWQEFHPAELPGDPCVS